MQRVLANNPFDGPTRQPKPAANGPAGSNASRASFGSLLLSAASSAASSARSLAPGVSPEGPADAAGADRPSAEEPAPEIPLSAIMMGRKRPAALIGKKLFYENDLLDGSWKIVAIRSHGIVVEPVSGAAAVPSP